MIYHKDGWELRFSQESFYKHAGTFSMFMSFIPKYTESMTYHMHVKCYFIAILVVVLL